MNELVYILEAAKKHDDNFHNLYKHYLDTNDEDSHEIAMWEHNRALGLLEAYEILADHKIYSYEIEDELAAIA